MDTQVIYDFSVKNINGEQVSLNEYKGKVLLIVNVASKCGFTPQYQGLQSLQDKHQSQGFEVLAFPCNQFAGQEPGNEKEIQEFCSLKYKVTFPLFAKIDVNGSNADPLFEFLKKGKPGIAGTEAIKWNFTKFLVSKDGQILRRYAPNISPEALEIDVINALK
ncbi:MAG: hypothetical protein RJB13_689 [Pseudomonadota bacterium]|jgi:glutathione peroxidase